MHEANNEMGLPPEPEKDEDPATSITFTGTEIDTEAMELRLPQEKLCSSHEVRTASLARKKGLQEAGTAVAYCFTITCLQGSESREDIPEVSD